MKKIIRYYYNISNEGEYILLQCEDKRLYRLSYESCSYIPELPPNSHAYPAPGRRFEKRKFHYYWERFVPHDNSAVPADQHYSFLRTCFQVNQDALYVLETGAIIHMHLQHIDGRQRTKTHFYTQFQSDSIALNMEALSKTVPTLTPIPIFHEQRNDLYPIEGGYIVFPGFCISGSLCDMGLYPHIQIEQARSVDFVQEVLSPIRNPYEFRPFKEIPRLLCELTHAEFDWPAWETATSAMSLPYDKNCVHPFHMNGVYVAELTIVNLIWGSDYFPYSDSYVLMLRYIPSLESSILHLIELIQKRHPRIQLITLDQVE